MSPLEHGEYDPIGDPQLQNPARTRFLERAKADYRRLQEFLSTGETDQRKKLTNQDEYIPGVVEISGGLYPKSPEIHAALMSLLYDRGYKIEDLTTEEARKESVSDKPAPEIMRAEGWSTGFAELRDDAMQRVGKCGSCDQYISISGVRSHGHQCEKCGAVTYQDMVKGSLVRINLFHEPKNAVAFKVMPDGETVTRPLAGGLLRGGSLVVEKYDDESGLIYCYGDLSESEKEGIDAGPRARELYRKLADAGHSDRIIINRNDITDVSGHVWNHKIVKLYDGKEYGEWDHLPVAETYSIYEPWYWAPAVPTPTLHEDIISAVGMVSDQGYYYQDGRTAFYDIHLDRMRRFVDHFTTLDLESWDRMIAGANTSGPGMIAALARFCHQNPIIENRPNIGNAIVGFADSMEGKLKSPEQIKSEIAYLATEGFTGTIDEAIEHFRLLGIIPSAEEVKNEQAKRDYVQRIWDSLDLKDS